MDIRQTFFGLAICINLLPTCAHAASLPTDVPANHWAASAVTQSLDNNILSLSETNHFQGDSIVTHAQALIALAKLAKILETGSWHTAASIPIKNKTETMLKQGNWKKRPLTRYALAEVLVRFGDFTTNGLPRPPADANDLGKSEALPAKVTITLASSNPAYGSLTYLAKNRMISANSPLIKPDNLPLHGSDLSTALAEMITGLNDRLTKLGLDANGSSNDASFHVKKPQKKAL